MKNKNYNKLAFGATLNSLGLHGSVGHSNCHNYGSVSGCDDGCPSFWNGECDVAEYNILEHDGFFYDYNDIDLIRDAKKLYNIQ